MDPFESSYTKVAVLPELPEGTPRVYRVAGGMMVLRRTGQIVEAIDGSCFTDDRAAPSEARLQRIFECIAAATDSPTPEWEDLVTRAGLKVEIVDNDVWVCHEQCAV